MARVKTSAASRPQTIPAAISALEAAVAEAKRLGALHNAAEDQAVALESRFGEVAKAAAAAVPVPEILCVAGDTKSLEMVRTMTNGEERRIALDHGAVYRLVARDQIIQHCAGDPAQSAPMLAALADYEAAKAEAERAAAPGMAEASAAVEKANARWMRALDRRDRAAYALLAIPANTPAEALEKLEVASRALGHKPKGIQFECDEDAVRALASAVIDLRRLQAGPPPPTGGADREAFERLRHAAFDSRPADMDDAALAQKVAADDAFYAAPAPTVEGAAAKLAHVIMVEGARGLTPAEAVWAAETGNEGYEQRVMALVIRDLERLSGASGPVAALTPPTTGWAATSWAWETALERFKRARQAERAAHTALDAAGDDAAKPDHPLNVAWERADDELCEAHADLMRLPAPNPEGMLEKLRFEIARWASVELERVDDAEVFAEVMSHAQDDKDLLLFALYQDAVRLAGIDSPVLAVPLRLGIYGSEAMNRVWEAAKRANGALAHAAE